MYHAAIEHLLCNQCGSGMVHNRFALDSDCQGQKTANFFGHRYQILALPIRKQKHLTAEYAEFAENKPLPRINADFRRSYVY